MMATGHRSATSPLLRLLLAALRADEQAEVVTRVVRLPRRIGPRVLVERMYRLSNGWTVERRISLAMWSSTRPSPFRHHTHRLRVYRDGTCIELGGRVSLTQAVDVLVALGVVDIHHLNDPLFHLSKGEALR